jgi:serine/threonine protein kinase
MPEPQYITSKVSAPFPFCFCTSTVQEVRNQYPRVILADFGVAIAEGDEGWPYKDTDPAGTVNWLPPEMPAWEERGEVWAAAAVVLALCQLKISGPLPPLPPDRDDAWEWFSSKDCRNGFTNFRFSKTYSGALRLVLRTCLQDDKTKRPYAFRLLSYIRACRKSTWDLGKPKFEKMPHWAFPQ